MQLNSFDWLIVVVSLVISFSPALFYMRRAGKGTKEFFASGQAAPWWLIGTSMVATTFSTDTPNLVTDFVRSHGVAYNWMWWSFLLTGMTTVFFYARLWRRSGVITDLEFYELRYSGRSAAFLRGFRAIYLGLFFNCVIMATVTLAAVKIANVMLGWDRLQTVIVCGLICVVFGSISGLWGVLTTDLLQFVLAMIGVTAAAYYALQHPQVGGLAGMLQKLRGSNAQTLDMIPPLTVHDSMTGAASMNWDQLMPLLIIPLAVQWWSVWYPGAEPGGGSYIAQRMLAARSEKDALSGTLWFNLAHYALRPWPWIIVALCSMLVFPTLGDIKKALPHVSDDLIGNDLAYPAMLTLLPHGMLGLLISSLLAAYVSTMTTHMNWGTSYLVLDFYKRFCMGRPPRQPANDPANFPSRSVLTLEYARGGAGAPPIARELTAPEERRLVVLSRVVSAMLMVVSAAIMFLLTTAGEGFQLMLSVGAGTGLIYLLRWFWWRINAWSEIAAMVASMMAAVGLLVARRSGVQIAEHHALLGSVAFTSLTWIIVTYLSSPAKRETLVRFYQLARPAGPGWRHIRAISGVTAAPDSMSQALLGTLLGCVLVYSALFGAGNFIYGNTVAGSVCAVLFVVSGIGLARLLSAMWRAPEL